MMLFLVLVLAILSIVAASVGAYLFSTATIGVGLVGLACWFGIIARLAQAAMHQKETRVILEDILDALEER